MTHLPNIVDVAALNNSFYSFIWWCMRYFEASYANLSSLLNEEYNELSREAIVHNFQIIKRKLREFDGQEVKKYTDYLLDNCSFGKD